MFNVIYQVLSVIEWNTSVRIEDTNFIFLYSKGSLSFTLYFVYRIWVKSTMSVPSSTFSECQVLCNKLALPPIEYYPALASPVEHDWQWNGQNDKRKKLTWSDWVVRCGLFTSRTSSIHAERHKLQVMKNPQINRRKKFYLQSISDQNNFFGIFLQTTKWALLLNKQN